MEAVMRLPAQPVSYANAELNVKNVNDTYLFRTCEKWQRRSLVEQS